MTFVSLIAGHAVWKMRLLFLLIPAGLRSNQYLVLSGLLMVFMVFFVLNGGWMGDFWMHNDVVRELSTHPCSPRHPELLLNAPHAFYSPYTLGLAWASRLFHLTSIGVLSVAAIVNFIIFLLGLNWFVYNLLGNGLRAFYTLFFVLFLWGPKAWDYSGFFHFRVLGYVLPYPSTFAMGLIFISWAMVISFLEQRNDGQLLAILLLGPVILLTHPLSAIVYFVGVIAIVVGFKGPWNVRDSLFILSVIPISFLFAFAWPYYPMLKLMLSQGAVLDVDNRQMYQGVIHNVYPALLGLLPLLSRLKANRRDPLVLMFAGLACIYLYGACTRHYSYGRVIFSMILTLDLALADWLCGLASWRALPRLKQGFAGVLVLVVVWGIYRNCDARTFRYLPVDSNTYSQYIFLQKYTKQYEVVLSDPVTSFIVPSFGGKVVALNCPLPFIKDYQQRRQDIKLFFGQSTSTAQRKAIIRRYKVDFILINKKSPFSQGLMDSVAILGTPLYSDSDFLLLKTPKK